jgi:serine/threonine-protein kinase
MLAYECLAGTPPFRGTPLEVALAHRDRPLPPLPPSVAVGVAALVMRLAAKDPDRRPNDAAEIAVWAGLLRDGVGVAPLQMWPEQPPAASRFQRRTILAYACVAVTAVVVIVLASVIGFASTPGPVAAAPAPVSSSSSGGSGGGDATAPPTRGPAESPGRSPAARSVAKRQPAAPNPAVAAADPAGPEPGHGHGKGPVAGPDPGHGKAKGKGHGQDD